MSSDQSSDSDKTKYILSWLKSVPTVNEALPFFSSAALQPPSLAPLKRSHSQSSGRVNCSSNSKMTTPIRPDRKKRGRPTREESNLSPGAFSAITTKGVGLFNAKRPSDPRTISERMEEHGLIIDDDEAFDRYPKFQEKVFRIIDNVRLPGPSPTSVKNLKTGLKRYGRASEGTFLMHIMPILLKDGFYTKDLKFGMSKDDQLSTENVQAIFRSFLNDLGIVINRDEELRGTLLPNRYMGQGFEAEMEKALKKGDNMKNAKPDFIFGIDYKKFRKTAQPPLPLAINNLLTIAPGMYHPFLIIEGKGDQGSTAQAEDQCRRGGSTLVHAARILNAEIGISELRQGGGDCKLTTQKANHDPIQESQGGITGQQMVKMEPTEDADSDTFVFSVTISPYSMEFYVNWYEGNQKDEQGIPNPLFHMNSVKSINLRDRKALKEVRQTLHNICEWGVNERYKEQRLLHEKFPDYISWIYDAENKCRVSSKKRKTGEQTSTYFTSTDVTSTDIEHLGLESDADMGSQLSAADMNV